MNTVHSNYLDWNNKKKKDWWKPDEALQNNCTTFILNRSTFFSFLFSCLVFVMVDLINWLQNLLNDIFSLHSIDQTLPTMKINLKVIENQAVSLLESILYLNIYIHQVYIDHLWENVHLLQESICLNKICK